MSTKITQRTKPVQVGVNATVTFNGNGVDRFLAITAGTITITTSQGLALFTAFPVTAGQVVDILFHFPDNSVAGTIVSAGGASGVLTV